MKPSRNLKSRVMLLAFSLPAYVSALSLSGSLTDLSGAPISGATVTLALAGTQTTTNASGFWQLGQTTSITMRPRNSSAASAQVIEEHGHLRLLLIGTNAAGQGQVRSSAAMSPRTFGRSATVVDTLLFSWEGSVRQRMPLDSYDRGALAVTPIDTSALLVRADGYAWGALKSLTVGIFNRSTRVQDSLILRMFLQGKSSQIHDLGMRCDIAMKYRADGFMDAGISSSIDSDLRKSHPYKLDSTCTDSSACLWAFDVPLTGLTLEVGTKARLDLMQDRHKVEMSLPPNPHVVLYNDLMNQAPTHNVFDTTSNSDWSFRRHVSGSDAGKSPLDCIGIPFTGNKEILDQTPGSVREAPYMAIYRKGKKVYGLVP
jgi:hypothetical protein